MIQEEGPGWRLARDPSREKFPVLIGGECWAIELTQDEWSSLATLLRDLIDEYERVENQLMPQECICLEIERDVWWGCLDGDRHSWSLKLVLNGESTASRGSEVFWPMPAAMNFAAAMRKMWDSCE